MAIEYTLKRGATGASMTVTLQEADETAFDMTAAGIATATITVWQGSSYASPVISAASMTIVTAASGIVRYDFDVTTSNIPAGEYNFEIVCTDGSGEKYVFPSDRRRPYGLLFVKDSSIGS